MVSFYGCDEWGDANFMEQGYESVWICHGDVYELWLGMVLLEGGS